MSDFKKAYAALSPSSPRSEVAAVLQSIINGVSLHLYLLRALVYHVFKPCSVATVEN